MHGGGDETRNAQAFRTSSSLMLSCTNLTPTRATASGSALLFWLCSFRILLWQPVLSRILRHRARRRGTRRGAAAVTPVMTTQAFWDHIA